MKDAYYFPHFCNARHDRKIKRLTKELGIEGYGIFFLVLEILREQIDFRYPIEDIDLLADELGTSEQKIRVVICNYKLFEIDKEEKFFSPKLIDYMQPYLRMKEQRRQAGIKSAEARRINSTNDRSTSVQLSFNENEQSKVNESKVNESKLKESRLYVTPEKFYNDNFGAITPHMADNIKHFIDDGVEEDLIIQKMKEAIEQNKRNWAWVQQALINLQADNIKTLDDYKSLKKEFNKKKSNKSKDSPEKSMYKEVTDDWEWPDHKDLD